MTRGGVAGYIHVVYMADALFSFQTVSRTLSEHIVNGNCRL